MTDRKTTDRKTGLSIFRRLDAGNVPAPWVPPELPASNAALGRAVAMRDRGNSLPAPWVPAELPASSDAPAVAKSDRAVAKLKPWVPPADVSAVALAKAEAPRNLPASVPDVEDRSLVEPQKRKKKGKRRKGEVVETVSGNTGGGQTTINIVNQVAAPAPVYVSPYWGWWGWGGPWRRWWW